MKKNKIPQQNKVQKITQNKIKNQQTQKHQTNQILKNLSLILSFSLLSINLARAQVLKNDFTQSKCEHVLTSSGEVQINRQWDINSGTCFIDIHPRYAPTLKYRDYYFDNQGHFMVFNSYGDGPEQQMTGVRDFFLFPIINDYPDYSIEKNGDVRVKMVSGHEIVFSAKNFKIVSFTPGQFSEKTLSSQNKGGVEIKPNQGFWLDAGFAKGYSRLSQPQLTSKIYSTKMANSSCDVKNSELFNYAANGEYDLKFKKMDLVDFLKSKCPTLNF